jgi:hypothetical protein
MIIVIMASSKEPRKGYKFISLIVGRGRAEGREYFYGYQLFNY